LVGKANFRHPSSHQSANFDRWAEDDSDLKFLILVGAKGCAGNIVGQFTKVTV
jgi:hypothetical protein